jgi:hypothetical protein
MKLFLIYLFILIILFPEKTYAYLDPGSGSYIFQILIAGVIGSLFFAKSILRKIINIVRKPGNENPEENSGSQIPRAPKPDIEKPHAVRKKKLKKQKNTL